MALFRKKKADRRNVYRVGATATDGKLWLGLQGGPAEADLHDVSAYGCGCTLPSALAKSVKVGDNLKLRLAIGGTSVPQLFLRAAVRSIDSPERGVASLGLEFQDMERVFSQLRDHQWRYFNRRSAFRVAPIRTGGEREEVRLLIPGIQQTLSFPIHDISATGLSISLRPGDEVEIPEGAVVDAKFTLEGVKQRLNLRLRFVHRTSLEGRVRIGFRIDVDETPTCEEQCDSIADYAISRQRKALATI